MRILTLLLGSALASRELFMQEPENTELFIKSKIGKKCKALYKGDKFKVYSFDKLDEV